MSESEKEENIGENENIENTEEAGWDYDDLDFVRDKLKEKQKEVKKLSSELGQKNEEHDVLYDKYLRVTAEYDNFRKRTAKEKEGIYSDAVSDALVNILPVADNMERALKFTDAEKVFEGLKMIYSQFTDSLTRLGIEEIKSDGEKFNPEIHNAVFHEEDESQPENTVTETLQKGYIKGDKVIRPAMVKVVN